MVVGEVTKAVHARWQPTDREWYRQHVSPSGETCARILIVLSRLPYYFFTGVFADAAVFAFCSCSFCIFHPWRTNLRVGLNSPSRWPIISSLTSTAICSLPLCTPIV